MSSGKNMAPKCGLYDLLKWLPCFYTFACWLLKTHDLATKQRLFAEEVPKGGGSLKGGLFAVVLRQREDSCPHFSSRLWFSCSHSVSSWGLSFPSAGRYGLPEISDGVPSSCPGWPTSAHLLKLTCHSSPVLG